MCCGDSFGATGVERLRMVRVWSQEQTHEKKVAKETGRRRERSQGSEGEIQREKYAGCGYVEWGETESGNGEGGKGRDVAGDGRYLCKGFQMSGRADLAKACVYRKNKMCM